MVTGSAALGMWAIDAAGTMTRNLPCFCNTGRSPVYWGGGEAGGAAGWQQGTKAAKATSPADSSRRVRNNAPRLMGVRALGI